jgi:hypothetical protein
VRRRLASPRFRRRLLRVGLVVGAIGAGVLVSVIYWNTAPPEPPRSGGVAQMYVEPTQVELSATEQKQAIATAARFVQTAVRRERMAEAFELAGPGIRQGLTLAEWQRGEVPVVPYPVDAARWKVDYSYGDELGLQVMVWPDRDAGLRPMVFSMALKSVGTGEGRRWMVDSWVPRGGTSGNPERPNGERPGLAEVFDGPPARARLGAEWLLVPFVVLVGALLLIPLALVLRERRRGRLAREHADAWERRGYSDSSSPS